MHSPRGVRRAGHALAALATAMSATAAPAGAASTVTVDRTPAGFELRVDGVPFTIKGAAALGRYEALKAAGANSIRAYGLDDAAPALVAGHRFGLLVMLTVPMTPARFGVDYRNPERVAQQLKEVKRFVLLHREHPALLLWAIGNELELDAADPVPIWRAVNEAARLIKAFDPHHPTLAVVTDPRPEKVAQIRALCPDIDLLGVNAFGGSPPTLGERLRAGGWDRPFVLTEFGALGQWQAGVKPWGAPIEPTSTEKAASYLAAYRGVQAGGHGLALGGYAFLWGWKQETTHTWHGMFLSSGERLGAVDAMAQAWSGRWPADRAPAIRNLAFKDGRERYGPGERGAAVVAAEDPEGASLRIAWTIHAETRIRPTGDPESAPRDFPNAVQRQGPAAEFIAPIDPGPYRLFVTVKDGRGGAATGNLPFLVEQR